MLNVFSVDLEDWFCAYNLRIGISDWHKQQARAHIGTEKILKLLEKHKVKATFFVLGWIAEKYPELIKKIEGAGHEIAVHGYSHQLITNMSPEAFEEDLKKALDILKGLTRQPILGFRAPSFSVTDKTLWAIKILKKHGIQYDSSIFPIGYHPDYGIKDAPLTTHKRDGITEVPLSVAEFGKKRVACSGGGYFRLLPYCVSKFLMRRCNAQGRPVIFYIHPWELDYEQPRKKLPLTKHLRHYTRLKKTESNLDKLLGDFQFSTMQEVLKTSPAA